MTPSQSGETLLKKYFKGHLLERMYWGFHTENPYHNVTHELQVIHYAHAAHMLQNPDWDLPSIRELILAAAFHDHNHSGGSTDDATNIKNAIAFTDSLPDPMFESIIGKRRLVQDIIRCTQFNGKEDFAREPRTLAEKAIRDADLCSIYSEEGRFLLRGLAKEMGVPLTNSSEIEAFVNNNREFLKGATMYTEFGQQIREYQLERACSQLYDFLMSNLHNA